MIANYYTLARITGELESHFSGLTIREIFTQYRGELVISCDQTTAVIIAGCEPSDNFIYVRKAFDRARRNSVNIFTGAVGGKIDKIFIHSSDRQTHIRFDDRREIVVQIFGSKANILLLDANGIISETFLKNSDAVMTPKDSDSIGLSTETAERILSGLSGRQMATALKQVFPRFGSVLIKELLFRTGLDEDKPEGNQNEVAQILNTANKMKDELLTSSSCYVYFDDTLPVRFSIIPLHHLKDLTYETFRSVSEAIQMYRAALYREKTILKDKEKIISALQRELGHLEKSLNNISLEAEKLQNPEQYETFGKLLIAQLHLLKKGDKIALVENYLDGSNELVEIPLDMHLTPAKNAERYFEKAEKSRRAKEEQRKHSLEITARTKYLSQLIEHAEDVTTIGDLNRFIKENQKELSRFGLKAERSGQITKEDTPPFRVFTVAGGFQVWAGKSGENNDLLSTRHTAKNDLWFHARGVGGSHVVLKIGTGKGEVSKQAIEQAASIAAYYSKMKNSKLVPVAMCEGKFVRKPKGVPAGTVTLEREKTLFVEPGLPQ
jgi:predicted ribosome quality control (RQC) complex YloA/Tae2 family protein